MEIKKNYIIPGISSDVPFMSDIVCGATLSGGGSDGPGSAEVKEEEEIEEEEEMELMQFLMESGNNGKNQDTLW